VAIKLFLAAKAVLERRTEVPAPLLKFDAIFVDSVRRSAGSTLASGYPLASVDPALRQATDAIESSSLMSDATIDSPAVRRGQQGGTIAVDSIVGEGTKCTVRLSVGAGDDLPTAPRPRETL